jgi:hypothetical protein
MSIEKENTMRALQDKPLLARKQWRCACGLHTWLLWKDPVVTRRGAYALIEQFRACGYCNKVERRVLSKELS